MESDEEFEEAHESFSGADDNFLEHDHEGPRKPQSLSKYYRDFWICC